MLYGPKETLRLGEHFYTYEQRRATLLLRRRGAGTGIPRWMRYGLGWVETGLEAGLSARAHQVDFQPPLRPCEQFLVLATFQIIGKRGLAVQVHAMRAGDACHQ